MNMNLFNRAVRENFVVVSIASGSSMDADSHKIIYPAIDASNPSFCEMLNPYGYMVYFLSRKSNSREKAINLKSQIDKLISSNQHLKSFSCNINEGPLVTTINWRGKVTSPPLGNAANMITT